MTLIDKAWLEAHRKDHTQAEIDALTIYISNNLRNFKVSQGMKKNTVKRIMKEEVIKK